jgi:hypothetical protein
MGCVPWLNRYLRGGIFCTVPSISSPIPGMPNGKSVDARTHFINRHEMRSSQKGRWQGVRRVAWRATRKERNAASALFGRIAALRIEVKTSSLDLDSRLALHPKQGKLALAPIDEMSSRCSDFGAMSVALE